MRPMTPASAPIRALPEHVINQIAAGEVIERPVSVVKELVENSLDAGASRIDIEVAAGGVERIVVADDGSGIRGHEIGAAFKRHWTNKIVATSDLDAIASLGFRGEALASIGAVADTAVVTRAAGEAHAWRVEIRAGQESGPPAPAHGNRGTRIEVRQLFYNVPARKRFLKQARTEYLHIYRLVRQLAFARPDVAFSLTQDGARGLHLRPAEHHTMAPRWQALFGRAFCAAAHAVDYAIDGVTVTGWVGAAELATNLADTQFLNLNGRVIRDNQLQHAIRLAYDDSIAPGRFASYALALALDPGTFDVNVHPGKLEVRFVDIRTLHDIVYATVKSALGGQVPALDSPLLRTAGTPVIRESGPAYAARASTGDASRSAHDAAGKPLALVASRYLLSSDLEQVTVIDLRHLWREIMRRRLRTETPVGRPLLLPQRVPTGALKQCLLGHDGLMQLGFEFSDLGQAGALMRNVPRVLPNIDFAAMIDVLAASLAQGGEVIEAVALAASAVIALGERGQVSRSMLDELSQAARAANCNIAAFAVPLTASDLAGLVANDP